MPVKVIVACLVALTGLSAILLGSPSVDSVPEAVVTTQHDLVASLARGLERSTTRAEADLEALAEAQKDGATLVAAASNAGWQGVSITDPAGKTLAVTGGSPVPLDRIPAAKKAGTSLYHDPAGGTFLLIHRTLSDGRTLAATKPFGLRPLHLDPVSGQSVDLILADGTSSARQGVAGPATAAYQELLSHVISAARAGKTSNDTIADPANPAQVTLVSGSAVGDSGATVVSVTHSTAGTVQSGLAGRIAAAMLLVVAALVAWLVWTTLVRPVLLLKERAKSAACDLPYQNTAGPQIQETQRLWQAFTKLGSVADPASGTRRGLPAMAGTLAAALAIATWSTTVIVQFGQGSAALPSQVAADMHNRIEDVAASLKETLDQGLRQTAAAAAMPEESQRAKALSSMAASDRYRSAYVLSPQGKVGTRHGSTPARKGRPVAEQGIQLDQANNRVPVIFTYARLADGSFAVTEFDLRYLTSILERVDGSVRVVDAELRTVLDTSGYRAFQPLESKALRDKASEALAGGSSATELPVSGTPSLVAATTISDLGLAIVADQTLRLFDLPGNQRRDSAWLLGVLALTLAVLLMGWNYFVLVRPLRTLADAAQNAAAGDLKSVITLRRHDEVGAIAVCAEICRQARQHGTDRLGGAARLRPPSPEGTR